MATHGLRHALLAIGLLQLHRLELVSAINCSLGKDEQIPVTNGEVLNLRQGETLIFDCIGEPEHHRKLTLRYNEESCHADINTTTLEYTWYCVIDSDGTLNVWGFERDGENTEYPLISVSITSYDPANPCTTTEDATSTSTTTSSVADGVEDQIHQDQPSTEEEPTANAANNCLKGAVIILGVFVLVLVITVMVMAMVIHRMRYKPATNKAGCMEEGRDHHTMPTGHTNSGVDHAHTTVQDGLEREEQIHSTAQGHTDEEEVSSGSDESVINTSTTKIKV